ncbi:MAG: hypothetical protein WD206_07385 [Actinomycetota bacterium]
MRGQKAAAMTRVRVAALAVSVLTLVAIGIPPTLAAPSTKKYTAVVTPTSAAAGQTSVLTFRIGNSTLSTQGLGSANISIPAGWTVAVCSPAAPCSGVTQDPSDLKTSGSPSRTWNATTSASVIKLRNPGPTSANRLRPGEHVDVAVAAEAPCSSGPAAWATVVKQSNDFSGVGNDFTLVGGSPTVTVTGACGGSLDHFTVSAPASTVAGEVFPITVVAEDATDQPVSNYVGTVQFTSSDPNSDLPADTVFTTNDQGSRTFTGIALRTSGTQSISVRDAALTSATGTASVAVGADPAVAELDITASATTIIAGGSVTFTATGSDRFGNALGDVTSSTGFEMTNGSCVLNSCTGTVAGQQTVTATNGSAQTLEQIQVEPAALDRIRLTPRSATITAGQSRGYTVRGFDEFGNLRGNLTSDASLSIAPDGTCGPSRCSATVAGPHLVTADVGAFSDTADLQVDPAAPDHLAFSQQPSRTEVDTTISPAVTVLVFDEFGNLAAGSATPVSLAIGPNPPDAGTLSGGGPVAANGGVATFEDLSIDLSGVDYTLVATSPGLGSATSDAFEISDVLEDCAQQGGCTGTVSDATTSATVTVPDYEGIDGQDGRLSLTLDPQNDADCAQATSASGSAIWVDPPAGESFTAPVRIDLEIEKSEAPGTGVANFVFCKDDGPGTPSERLPDCRKQHPSPPCVLKRSRSGVGDLLATILIQPLDPRLATRK